MICDNCGAEIDKKERYCPNCGMELPGPTPKPSKKKYYKNSRAPTRDDSHSQKNYRNYYDEEEDFERKPSKRSHHEDPADFTYDIPHPRTDYRNYYDEEEDYERKPLKRKYYERPSASAHYDSQYQDEPGYESYYTDEDDYETQKSGTSLGTILFVLIIILLLGFIIGLIMFSSNQIIPQVPGINS
jgi:hypothetical protein